MAESKIIEKEMVFTLPTRDHQDEGLRLSEFHDFDVSVREIHVEGKSLEELSELYAAPAIEVVCCAKHMLSFRPEQGGVKLKSGIMAHRSDTFEIKGPKGLKVRVKLIARYSDEENSGEPFSN